jgi:hypothetical protein
MSAGYVETLLRRVRRPSAAPMLARATDRRAMPVAGKPKQMSPFEIEDVTVAPAPARGQTSASETPPGERLHAQAGRNRKVDEMLSVIIERTRTGVPNLPEARRARQQGQEAQTAAPAAVLEARTARPRSEPAREEPVADASPSCQAQHEQPAPYAAPAPPMQTEPTRPGMPSVAEDEIVEVTARREQEAPAPPERFVVRLPENQPPMRIESRLALEHDVISAARSAVARLRADASGPASPQPVEVRIERVEVKIDQAPSPAAPRAASFDAGSSPPGLGRFLSRW